MSEARHLIVNADDFGQSTGITQGIVDAFERGIVTSTSMMVRGRDAAAAAAYARRHPALSVGLHLDLGEWTLRDSEWVPVYEVVPTEDRAAVSREIERQLEQFRDLVGADPTHVDSHQHVHQREPARAVAMALAERLGVPLRHFSATVQYRPSFYAQSENGETRLDWISPDALVQTIGELPAGISELSCHPAREIDIETLYADERLHELRTLCDPRVRSAPASAGVVLCSFRNIPRGAATRMH